MRSIVKETSDYGARLKALKEEQLRLERKQTEADDDALAGVLLELKDALSRQ
jgi:hypothetical protein